MAAAAEAGAFSGLLGAAETGTAGSASVLCGLLLTRALRSWQGLLKAMRLSEITMRSARSRVDARGSIQVVKEDEPVAGAEGATGAGAGVATLQGVAAFLPRGPA